jgi:hypothetical protein
MNTHSDLYFGEIAVKNGYASTSEIELALEAQKEGPAFESETPPKLGEILVEMGTLTPEQIKSVLEAQSRLRQSEEASSDAVKFEEIQPAALVQESGPALIVNDEPLTAPRTLKAGDRLKAGDLLFRFSGESIEIVPRREPSPAESSTALGIPMISPPSSEPSAETPAEPKPASAEAPKPEDTAPKPKLSEKLLPVLRAIDGWVAKLPPALHTQRKYVLAAALLGGIAFLLPWRIAGNGNSVLGIQGPGWLTLLLSLVPIGCTLFSRPGDPFTKVERLAATSASALALLIGLVKFLWAPSYATARGIGLYLGALSSLGLVLAVAFARAGGTGAAATDAPTLGMRLWKKLSGFVGSMSGKRAKELGLAIEQRDTLLRRIGEAALEAHKELPEAAAAIQAREALQKADQEIADPKTATVKSKAAQKVADAKAKRAFAKLAQKAIEAGLDGQEAAIGELRAAEAKIKELS